MTHWRRGDRLVVRFCGMTHSATVIVSAEDGTVLVIEHPTGAGHLTLTPVKRRVGDEYLSLFTGLPITLNTHP